MTGASEPSVDSETVRLVRELHAPLDDLTHAICSAAICDYERWPCQTARLVYTADEKQLVAWLAAEALFSYHVERASLMQPEDAVECALGLWDGFNRSGVDATAQRILSYLDEQGFCIARKLNVKANSSTKGAVHCPERLIVRAVSRIEGSDYLSSAVPYVEVDCDGVRCYWNDKVDERNAITTEELTVLQADHDALEWGL